MLAYGRPLVIGIATGLTDKLLSIYEIQALEGSEHFVYLPSFRFSSGWDTPIL